jgi:pyruvate/2-oxoglutarate dehydrogenase complex dihydrolipoamide dehydrogenase (E3) component
LAVLIALVINLAFAFMCVGLPMVVFHAPTWAWVGLTFAAVYASIDRKS